LHQKNLENGRVVIYSDGACSGNPGKGGYGTVLLFKSGEKIHRKELSDGFKITTNNRMELLGVISGLQALIKPAKVSVYTDSKYIVDAINKKWLINWKKKNWINSAKKPVKNRDLWELLDNLMFKQEEIDFHWVKGHSGLKENEVCDQLAVNASQENNLKEDTNYL
jgi:ribonuclease HI